MKPYVLVTASVSEEADGIIREMGSPKTTRVGGRPIFSGNIGKRFVRLIETGPGMVNTAQALTAVIEAGKPEAILMTGCAGGFARAEMDVGDIGIATEENDAQLGIESGENAGSIIPLPFDLGVYDGECVKHRVPLNSELSLTALDILTSVFGGMPFNIVPGPFITVSTITATVLREQRLYDRFRPCMENMEGVAAAYVAKHYRIPFLEIRCASNLAGKRDRSSWDLPLACKRSAEAAIVWLRNQV